MSAIGDIGSKIGGELANVAKQAAKDTVKAGADIAKATIETVATGGVSQTISGQQGEGKAQEKGQAAADPAAAQSQQRKAMEQRRYQEILGELEQYRQKKKREEEQKEQVVEEQKKMEDIQMKESAKKQREKSLLKGISRQYGGAGEQVKAKY